MSGEHRLHSAVFKDTLREIARTRSRFLSIFMIVALGAGFFAGLKMTCPDMMETAEKYYASHDLMDIKLVSTYGFADADIEAIRAVDGVDGILPSYSKDVYVRNDQNANIIAKVMAIPDKDMPDWADTGMNSVVLMEGRMPQAPDECLAENSTGLRVSYSVGQQITVFSADEEDDPLSDSLERDTWTVVGIVRSPQYISFERGSTDIGNGSLDCFIMVPSANFKLDVYTEVYVTLDKPAGLSAFSDEYDDIISAGEDRFEALADVREPARYQEVVDEANEKIANAKTQLWYGKQEAAEEIGDGMRELDEAQKKLTDARKELDDGWSDYLDGEKKLADSKKEYDDKMADAEKDLADARKKLDDNWDDYYDGVKQLEDGKKDYKDGFDKLNASELEFSQGLKDAGYDSIDDMRAALDSGDAQVTGAQTLLSGARSLMNYAGSGMVDYSQAAAGLSALDPQLGQLFAAYMASGDPALGAQLDYALSSAEDGLAEQQKKLDEGRDGLAQLVSARAQLDEGWADLKAAKAKLDKAEKELEAAYAMLQTGEEQYKDGLKEYEDGKKEGADKIADAEKKLADALTDLHDGEKEYADGLADYNDGLKAYQDGIADAKKELSDAQQKITDAQNDVAKLKRTVWYVFDRNDNPGYSTYDGDAHRIEAVAQVFPVFFFLVAALVCLTTMTRMVEEQRTEIGTLKALGYGRGRIASKYLVYASIASVAGALSGIALGCYIFPTVIFGAYGMMYIMPEISLSIDPLLAAGIVVVCLACTTLSAFAACNAELRSNPAELMRPRAPKPGKRVLLERVGFIWKRLNFTQKVTIRNLFRYKRRILMTVIGIAGCTALTLTGVGLNASISSIMDKQYDEIFRYDLITALDDKAEQSDMDKVYSLLNENSLVKASMPVYEKSATVGRVNDVSLFVLMEPQDVETYLNLRERVSQRHIDLTDDGVVITEKLSELLSLKVGDEIKFTVNKTEASVPVTGISENYALHFIYMTPACYEKYFGSEPAGNIILTVMTDTSKESRDKLASQLIDEPAVLALTFAQDSRDNFDDVIQNLNYVVILVIISAALLAFVVLYNLTNINVTERIREIATIKVLGFYDREVSAYVYRENMLLTLMGDAAGLVLGIWLHRFVISVAETDAAMFGRTLPPWCFISAFLMTIIFSLIVNWIMYFVLKKISMVESLKSVE